MAKCKKKHIRTFYLAVSMQIIIKNKLGIAVTGVGTEVHKAPV
jgi:hypothetical protein